MRHGARGGATRAALAAFVVVSLVGSRATAQDVDPSRADPQAVLAQIGEAELYARYDEAIRSARALLLRDDLTATQRNQGLEKLAIAELANGNDHGASDTLRTLYARDPQHRLDDADASPRVQSAFSRARESHPPTVRVRLEHTPQPPETHEAPVISVVVTEGADAVDEVRLSYREPGDTRFTRVTMAYDHGVARARVPVGGDAGSPQSIAYFLEAVAPSGASLARVASEDAPLEVTVPPAAAAATPVTNVDPEAGATGTPPTTPATSPEHVAQASTDPDATWQLPHIGDSTVREGEHAPTHPGTSVTDEWWFWTLIGVAVIAGGATAIYFAVGPPSQPDPTGSLGVITLR